jgi:hypothetical protein
MIRLDRKRILGIENGPEENDVQKSQNDVERNKSELEVIARTETPRKSTRLIAGGGGEGDWNNQARSC